MSSGGPGGKQHTRSEFLVAFGVMRGCGFFDAVGNADVMRGCGFFDAVGYADVMRECGFFDAVGNAEVRGRGGDAEGFGFGVKNLVNV